MIDITRSLEVFSPTEFGSQDVHFIGLGALGSAVALEIACLGLQNMHFWDDDRVEVHNLGNQAYDLRHIGQLKVNAMANIIDEKCGYRPSCYPKKYTTEPLSGIVFVLVDCMDARKEIFEQGVKLKSRVKLMIEARMGAEEGRIYTINPTDPVHIQSWEDNFYPNEEAQTSLCGAPTSVGATARALGGLCAWRMIDWHDYTKGKKENEPPVELIVGLRSGVMLTSTPSLF